MQPENFRFGGGASETILHPLVLVAMLIAMALVFLLPRKYLVWPVLCMAFLVPIGQEILIGGLHFYVIRIIILTVAVRLLAALFSSPQGIFEVRLGTFVFVFLSYVLSPASCPFLSIPAPWFTRRDSSSTLSAATSSSAT
jgi:hypothetical protein